MAAYTTTRCFKHKAGRWVWTHVAVSLLRDEEGKPLHLIAQMESLEARQRAEENLADERERLTITLQSISDAVITTDAATCITYVNAAAEALLGFSAQSANGRRVHELIYLMDPQSSKAAANLIGQSALHGAGFRREQACVLHRPDGSFCYVTDSVSPVLDAAGLVTGLVIVFRDATLDVDRTRDMQHRALHDPLTALSNRNEFDQRLGAAFRKAQFLNSPAALMAIDLDRFKALNDAAGHAAGDRILKMVAEACRKGVRSSDTVARLGGDEFAIILENCSEKRAHRIGEPLVGMLNPLEQDGHRHTVGASIGLATFSPSFANEKIWFEAADKACYIAKRAGRGRLQDASLIEEHAVARHG